MSTNFGESMGYDSMSRIVDADGKLIAQIGDGTSAGISRHEEIASTIVRSVNEGATEAATIKKPTSIEIELRGGSAHGKHTKVPVGATSCRVPFETRQFGVAWIGHRIYRPTGARSDDGVEIWELSDDS